jgi:hypothetical protein
VNLVPDGTDQNSVSCSTDPEDDHGKEVEGKEEIREEKGRAGPQKEENSKVGGKEVGEEVGKEGAEESREKGCGQGCSEACSEAQSTGEEAGNARAGPGSRADASPSLDAACQFRLRRRPHLVFSAVWITQKAAAAANARPPVGQMP